ncbi:DUF1372 family protein [Streptococcus ruminantium]|uniref:DUF1372 family protein n=1 Tax=Streptococcus ruminantium TaxID=1917441 RepID=UPI0023519139|nr:DUF1372 family protein [Streptococcus ruminantium]BDD42656.1 hypothetical protein GUT189_09890 [Streptococcus ruminantium]
MKRYKISLTPILLGIILSLVINLSMAKQKIRKLKSREPVIIYQTDNAGAAMFGKITDKEIIEGRYTVTAEAYGKFLVTKEQYEAIKVGDPIPEYLKGRKQ